MMEIQVFLADDHAILRDGLRSILEGQRDMMVVGDASDGRATVQQVQQLCPDVVIMDISMPDLNGIDATHHIREQCPSTQVIILSIHAAATYVSRALQMGARGYILKESAGDEVVAAIRAVHAGRRYLSGKITETVIDDYVRQGAMPQIPDLLDRLSRREREVLQLLVEGHSCPDIAEKIFLSPKTVHTYRSRIMQKLEISDMPSLVKFAIQYGLTPAM